MISSVLLQFVVDNPWISFGLSLPFSLILISASWAAATLITNAMNACASIFNQFLSFIIVLARGYPPSGPVQDHGEDKPLAG